MNQQSIADLIISTAQEKNQLGRGTQATVYGFEDPAFAAYALRIDRKSAFGKANDDERRTLLSNSKLSQSSIQFDGHNYGQPLISGDGFSICLRQPGRNLNQIYDDAFAGAENLPPLLQQPEAYTQVLEALAALPQQAFERLLGDMNFLTHIGHAVDHGWANTMVGDGTLGWVDITTPVEYPLVSVNSRSVVESTLLGEAAHNVKFTLGHIIGGHDDHEADLAEGIENRRKTATHTMLAKLNAAALITHTPEDFEAIVTMREHTPLAFAPGAQVSIGCALKMTDTPAELLELLAATASGHGLPRR